MTRDARCKTRSPRAAARRPRRRRRACAAIGLAIFVAFVATSADAQRRVEIYEVQFRIADELLPLAQTAMGSAEAVALDRGTNSLVLMGDPETVAGALALLERQDRSLRTVLIRYDSMRTSELFERGYDIRWQVARGDFRIGSLVVRSPADASVTLRARTERRRLVESFGSMMRVTEGARTKIETGTALPFEAKGSNGAHIDYVDASTGFVAAARILGDGRVRIELGAFAARLAGAGGSIMSSAVSTEIDVESGETVVVAELDRASERERAKHGNSKRSESARDAAVWLLHVELE